MRRMWMSFATGCGNSLSRTTTRDSEHLAGTRRHAPALDREEDAGPCRRSRGRPCRRDDYQTVLGKMYGNEPGQLVGKLSGYKRLRFIINCLTRMRMITADNRMDCHSAARPGARARGIRPWYKADAQWHRHARRLRALVSAGPDRAARSHQPRHGMRVGPPADGGQTGQTPAACSCR